MGPRRPGCGGGLVISCRPKELEVVESPGARGRAPCAPSAFVVRELSTTNVVEPDVDVLEGRLAAGEVVLRLEQTGRAC